VNCRIASLRDYRRKQRDNDDCHESNSRHTCPPLRMIRVRRRRIPNQLIRKLPTAEGRALPRQINKPLAVRLLAPTSIPFHCFGGGVIAAPPSGSGFCRVS
jgi:hypothetical protein